MYLALARHGSLSAAARALGVNHATVARRLQSLEAGLGEKLVERRAEGYVLTPAGTRVLDAASDMENAAQALGRQSPAAQDEPRGLVRINAPPGLAAGYLTARLAGLAARYPFLDIDLATNLRSISLERHEADIAIRIGRPEDGDVIARPLGSIAYGFYGTRDARERTDPVFIGFDEADSFVPEAVWLARHFPRARLAFRANNHASQAIAARSGVGIALLPHYIGRQEPALELIDLGMLPPPRELYMVTRRRDRTLSLIRTIAESIVKGFEEDRALFA